MARQVDLDNRDQVVAFLDEHVLNAEKVGELAGLTRNSVYVYAGRDGLGFPQPLPFLTRQRPDPDHRVVPPLRMADTLPVRIGSFFCSCA